MNDKEFENEKQYLNDTVKAIDARISDLTENVNKQKDWALELKKQYIHDLRDFDEAEFVDNYNKLNDLLDFTDDQIAQIKRLEEIRDKPYFGRIDFLIDGDDEPMKLYIGLKSIDYKNNLYVIDWRAPVSELFYESGKGRASYVAPNGKIEGEITLKRQYEIEKAKLLEVFDVDINLFDEYLQQILSKTKGDSLQNIASTIQKEQNEIIRDLKDDILVVQGYAGSGKTTIALHHVAYALYRLDNLKSANVLFFSPNEAFLSYISKVLPDLGEDNTRSATFPKFIKRFLKSSKPIESSDEFVLRYAFLDATQKKEVDNKLKFETRQKMQNWLTQKSEKLEFLKDIQIEDLEFTKEELNTLLQDNFKHAKYREKVFLIANGIFQKLNTQDVGKREVILEKLFESLNMPMHIEEIYQTFLKDFGYKMLDQDDKLWFEDAVLMSVLKELSQNVIIRMDIKQVVLDEAQDYPLIFIDLILRIFKHASFSIFGDKNQKTVPGELSSLKDITNLEIAKDRCKFVELTKTYRSSEEIVEYASKIIKDERHNAFRLKNGNPVVEQKLGKDIKQISKQISTILSKLDTQNTTIGIITGDTETSKQIFDELEKEYKENITCIKNAYTSAGTNIQIVPIALSKGLEFDTVIVVQKGKLFEHNEKDKFVFIATTRAINKLFVLK